MYTNSATVNEILSSVKNNFKVYIDDILQPYLRCCPLITFFISIKYIEFIWFALQLWETNNLSKNIKQKSR